MREKKIPSHYGWTRTLMRVSPLGDFLVRFLENTASGWEESPQVAEDRAGVPAYLLVRGSRVVPE